MTNSLDLADVQKWKKEAELASLDRGEHLDIYQLRMDKGRFCKIELLVIANCKSSIAPTMAEIRLRLTENELSTIGRTGAVAWLIEGINIENAQ